jgi:hypothetical protein
MGANTIIVILGASGHEYVAEIGCVPVVTSHLDKATPMTPEHAEEVIRNLVMCQFKPDSTVIAGPKSLVASMGWPLPKA